MQCPMLRMCNVLFPTSNCLCLCLFKNEGYYWNATRLSLFLKIKICFCSWRSESPFVKRSSTLENICLLIFSLISFSMPKYHLSDWERVHSLALLLENELSVCSSEPTRPPWLFFLGGGLQENTHYPIFYIIDPPGHEYVHQTSVWIILIHTTFIMHYSYYIIITCKYKCKVPFEFVKDMNKGSLNNLTEQ